MDHVVVLGGRQRLGQLQTGPSLVLLLVITVLVTEVVGRATVYCCAANPHLHPQRITRKENKKNIQLKILYLNLNVNYLFCLRSITYF